jgi:hypothetical protein
MLGTWIADSGRRAKGAEWGEQVAPLRSARSKRAAVSSEPLQLVTFSPGSAMLRKHARAISRTRRGDGGQGCTGTGPAQ